MNMVFVGVDIHKDTHTAYIADCFGERLECITFDNNSKGFKRFTTSLNKHTKDGKTSVIALEDTTNFGKALCNFLLKDNKYHVKYVEPVLTKNERKSTPIAHKTDEYDSLCIVRILITRLNTLPDARMDDNYWTISQLVKRRDGVIKFNTALKNQLHAQLQYHYVRYNKFFGYMACKTALNFWKTYPCPTYLLNADVEDITSFIKKVSHNNVGRAKVEEIIKMVKEDGKIDIEYEEERIFLIKSIANQLLYNMEEIKNIDDNLRSFMKKLDYKLDTMPGLDLVSASSIVAEIGDINRFKNSKSLARYAGICPITMASGKTSTDFYNRYGNRKLYGVVYYMAIRAIAPCRKQATYKIIQAYYNKKIKDGKTKKQAVICICRRLINIIYHMMKNKTEYVHPVIETKEEDTLNIDN